MNFISSSRKIIERIVMIRAISATEADFANSPSFYPRPLGGTGEWYKFIGEAGVVQKNFRDPIRFSTDHEIMFFTLLESGEPARSPRHAQITPALSSRRETDP
jgi:hypothetical protein